MSEANAAAKAALDEIKAGEGTPSKDEVVDDTATEIETQAAEMGWTPEGVEGKRNLTAEEFVDRQGLYTDIKNLKKSNKKLQDGLDATLKMQDGIRERERTKVIKELHVQKKEALEEENYDEVIKIDEDLATARAEATTDVPNRAFDSWVEENPWYRSNTEMQQFADMMGAGINTANDKLPMADVYAKVKAEVEKRFPDEFETGNAARRRQSAVEGAGQGRQGAGGGGKPTRYTVADLPEQDREIMQTVKRATGMSEQDYLKSYFDL